MKELYAQGFRNRRNDLATPWIIRLSSPMPAAELAAQLVGEKRFNTRIQENLAKAILD